MTFILPALFILTASLLWATDFLVRTPLLQSVDPAQIVYFEHLAGLLFALPFFLFKKETRAEVGKVQSKDFAWIIVAGIVGSSLGGLLYASGSKHLGASLATLFQMIQPLVVLALATFLLKEKVSSTFVPVGVWVVFNAILISTTDFSFGSDTVEGANISAGFFASFGAVIAWGMSTVAGKILCNKFSAQFVVFARWLTAVVFLTIMNFTNGVKIDFSLMHNFKVLGSILVLGGVFGVLPMFVYYLGMKRMKVTQVTFIELFYPLAGSLIPYLMTGEKLTLLQLFGTVTLCFSVWMLLFLEQGFENTTSS